MLAHHESTVQNNIAPLKIATCWYKYPIPRQHFCGCVANGLFNSNDFQLACSKNESYPLPASTETCPYGSSLDHPAWINRLHCNIGIRPVKVSGLLFLDLEIRFDPASCRHRSITVTALTNIVYGFRSYSMVCDASRCTRCLWTTRIPRERQSWNRYNFHRVFFLMLEILLIAL